MIETREQRVGASIKEIDAPLCKELPPTSLDEDICCFDSGSEQRMLDECAPFDVVESNECDDESNQNM